MKTNKQPEFLIIFCSAWCILNLFYFIFFKSGNMFGSIYGLNLVTIMLFLVHLSTACGFKMRN